MNLTNSGRLVRAYMYDLARQLERPDFIVRWLPRYAEWGYDELFLYLEDAFDFPSVPGIGRHRAFTPRQMEAVVREATRRHIRVVPILELLGHMTYVLKLERFQPLNELRDGKANPAWSGQICPLQDDTLKLARQLLCDVQPYCTSGFVYVGLDEAFDIGKCPRCCKEVEAIGPARHFANYVGRLRGLCHELGLRMAIAGDMLYYFPEAISLLPKDVVVFDWFYYPFRKVPRVEYFNFADVDLTAACRRAGLAVYGNPTNGVIWNEVLPPFLDRLQLIKDWWRYCHQRNAQGMLVTSWSPVRVSPELNTVVDAAAASLWLEPRTTDPRRMLALGLERVFGKNARRHAALVAATQDHQWTGYYRWQANTKWSALANFEPASALRREREQIESLRDRAVWEEAPAVLRDSLGIRLYVTKREQLIREGSRWIAAARQAVQNGRSAAAEPPLTRLGGAAMELKRDARAMLRATRSIWNRSRFQDDPNPNETMFRADLLRLDELVAWNRAVVRNPQKIWDANPILGRWHLLFWVRNFAPALQAVVIELRRPDGTWQTVHSLFSMEFTADAGRPRSDFRRRHSVAIDWDGLAPIQARLAIRGLGQFEIYGLQATDGVHSVLPSRIAAGGGSVEHIDRLTRRDRPGAVLGERAPRSGFISIDWSAIRTWVGLELSPIRTAAARRA